MNVIIEFHNSMMYTVNDIQRLYELQEVVMQDFIKINKDDKLCKFNYFKETLI